MSKEIAMDILLGISLLFLSMQGIFSESQSTPSEEVNRMTRSGEGPKPQSASLPDNLGQIPNTLNTAYFLGQCLVCPPGPQGPAGQQGTQGPPGRDGRDAILVDYHSSDQDHARNNDGPTSPPQPHQGAASQHPGTTYTRWGRPICPNDALLIYAGVMAGSHYTHAGGAANYLCLSTDPIFDRPTAGHQFGAYIYGTEYETGSSDRMPGLQNFEAPCAVCLALTKSITLLVPGRNECPEGPEGKNWTLEYKGYLMSQHHTHPRTEYICVDSEAEGVPRTHGDHNGALLYIVEAACATGGGIPCPPYANGYEITCAVCSL